jgi:hypothetical protein
VISENYYGEEKKPSNIHLHRRSSRAAMPDAHACRGRDGSGCGFGATRQVNSTNKKTGKTYYKRLCFQSGMIVQVCCETGFSRMNMIMTKTRNNLLVVTLDALLMLLITGPSLEPGVPSPTIELSELCKLGYAHWTKVKNRNPKRCQHVSRARRVDEPSALHHNVYRDAPAFRLFLHGDGADEGEEERSQGSQQEEVEEEGEAIEADIETIFGLVGPYKAPANWEVLPEETVTAWTRGLHLQGFIKGRKVVMLWKPPTGWCEGMLTYRCKRNGQDSNVYTVKYDDGMEVNHPCEREKYGTGLGKAWCVIQPIPS